MQASGQVLSSGSSLMVSRNSNATLVILKCATNNTWTGQMNWEMAGLELIEHIHNGNYFTQSSGEGNVFCLGSAQRNKWLKLGCLKYGTASIVHNYIPGA
jgi:hypothetical protein